MQRLPVELQDTVCRFLPYADRVELFKTNAIGITDPFAEFAENFIPINWKELSVILHETSSFIGGSVALRFFSNLAFKPDDLDIYGCAEHIPTWRTFLIKHGFEEVAQREDYGLYALVVGSIQDFRRGDNKISYITGLHAKTEIDNTANHCSIWADKAVCPYYNHVSENIAEFSPNTFSGLRMAKMQRRGFGVSVRPYVTTFTRALQYLRLITLDKVERVVHL